MTDPPPHVALATFWAGYRSRLRGIVVLHQAGAHVLTWSLWPLCAAPSSGLVLSMFVMAAVTFGVPVLVGARTALREGLPIERYLGAAAEHEALARAAVRAGRILSRHAAIVQAVTGGASGAAALLSAAALEDEPLVTGARLAVLFALMSVVAAAFQTLALREGLHPLATHVGRTHPSALRAEGRPTTARLFRLPALVIAASFGLVGLVATGPHPHAVAVAAAVVVGLCLALAALRLASRELARDTALLLAPDREQPAAPRDAV